MAIKIVTDSTISIEPNLVEELDITIVPLTITIDGVSYQDGSMTQKEFMEKMAASKNLPMTSQPPVGLFAEIYDNLGADGSEIISIHLTKVLSGTMESARQASNISSSNVTVVDSKFIDQALKFQVVEAARLAKEGASKEEILAAIENIRSHSELFIGVATLENLIKGGRVGHAAGLVGSLLNIKLILSLTPEKLEQEVKGRGNKTFQKWVDSFAASLQGKKVKEIGISHADNLAFSQHIKELLQPYVEKPISILETNSTIVTHAGPGAWAVMAEYE
ncbi:DegV family protein [Streptococcaceae bacterium ESL0729]|nr:DegV family protein [Streptococcaceae bacterium ESL0729]